MGEMKSRHVAHRTFANEAAIQRPDAAMSSERASVGVLPRRSFT
jgi:hypothetical protein